MFKKNKNPNRLRSIQGGGNTQGDDLGSWLNREMIRARNSPGWKGDHIHYTEDLSQKNTWGKYLLIVLLLIIIVVVGYMLFFPH